jgi:hypothetical protein
MNINTVSNLSNTKLCIQPPSFKSIIPCKVFIDGNICSDVKKTNKTVRELSNVLFQPQPNQSAQKIKQIFSRFDRNFRYVDKTVSKGKTIRNRCFSEVSYLFTGPQAEQLDELGRKIGKAKAIGRKFLGTTKTFEVMCQGQKYFEQIQKFINSNSRAKIRESINPETGAYEGNEIGLHILAKSEGMPDTKGFKLIINDIVFRKIKGYKK